MYNLCIEFKMGMIKKTVSLEDVDLTYYVTDYPAGKLVNRKMPLSEFLNNLIERIEILESK